MADPTKANLITDLQNLVELNDEIRKFGESNSPNFVGLQDQIIQAVKGDHASQVLAGVDSLRALLNSMVTGAREAMDEHLRDWAKYINDAGNLNSNVRKDVSFIISDLYDQMIVSGDSVLTRNMTFNAPSSFGAGKGSVKRLTVDENAFDIENGFAEKKIVTCINDANSGRARNNELFRLEGETRSIDEVESKGSGLNIANMVSETPERSVPLNASFDLRGGTDAAPTSIDNWTVSGAVSASTFTFFAGSTTPANIYLPLVNANIERRGLQVKATNRLRQSLEVRRAALDPDTPYYARVSWLREYATGSGAGVVSLKVGSQEVQVSATTQTGWQTLELPLDENLWFRNFNVEGLEVQVGVELLSGTGIILDDLIVVPMRAIDGVRHVIVPGRTPFLEGDTSNWADTQGNDAKIQNRFRRDHGRFLPHDASPTIADP